MTEGGPMVLTLEPVNGFVAEHAALPTELRQFLDAHPLWRLYRVDGWTVLPPESESAPEPPPPSPREAVLVGGRQ